MPQAYEIYTYDLITLRRLLTEKTRSDAATVDGKRHMAYFDGYFNTIGAKTIVVENNYTDRDYLEDFAGYYVRCFEDYKRKCTRLHFFTESFDIQEFDDFLASNGSRLTAELLQKAYLGFVVVKPLPQTLIGRTCLRTYPSEDRRHFPITRAYEANLFGITLTVESLAYQEQDAVAAACATSALWAAFHGTGKQFQHHIPSPVEITKSATAHVPLDSRTFPNSNGLTLTQMSEAIRSVGLEPYLVNASDEWALRSTLYAYLHGQIPVLLWIELYDPNAAIDAVLGRQQPFGYHALTVTGYSLGKPAAMAYPNTGFILRAFRMDKIYAHDDQIGPFARMEFLKGTHFTTSWLCPGNGGAVQAYARAMLIPLYHKIRIPYQTIFGIVGTFGSLIETLHQNGIIPLHTALEWDIFLTNINAFKSEMLNASILDGQYRQHVITQEMPRFLWRATALQGDTPVLELIFDATDIEQGSSFVGVIAYDVALVKILAAVTQVITQSPDSMLRADKHILTWLANTAF